MIPVNSTFVVEIDPQESELPGVLRGHVEHVLSGNRSEFDSSEMLLGFFAETLCTQEAAQAKRSTADRKTPGGDGPDIGGSETSNRRKS